LKPATATAIASTHMRMRVQSPMLTMSAMAPMVQKFVFWARAPKTIAQAKLLHNTALASVSGSIVAVVMLSRRR